jgi:hypothetical protein
MIGNHKRFPKNFRCPCLFIRILVVENPSYRVVHDFRSLSELYVLTPTPSALTQKH